MAPFIGCSARAFIANVSLSNLEAIQNTQDTFTIIPIVCNLVSVESRGCCVRNPRRKQYATECMVLSFSPSLLHFICCECLVIMIIIYNHDPLVRSDQIIHWAKSSRLSSRVCILKSLSQLQPELQKRTWHQTSGLQYLSNFKHTSFFLPQMSEDTGLAFWNSTSAPKISETICDITSFPARI